MSQIALLSRNGSTSKRQTFLQQTVQDFFGGLKWEGLPPPSSTRALPETLTDQTSDPLSSPALRSATTSVDQYFTTFPWDGEPVIGGLVVPEIDVEILPDFESEEADTTLDSFFDSF